MPRPDDPNEPPVTSNDPLDGDLAALTRDELVAEVRRLRAGIRAHRDSTRQELCWHHPQLWGLLPEPADPRIEVPDWPQFMRGCVRYRQSLDEQRPGAPRVTDEFNAPALDDTDQQKTERK